MDPNPNSFPILSYVMAKVPSMSSKSEAGSFEFDIEQPPPPKSDPSTSKGPYFELTERMPHLSDPKVIESMRAAVSDVARTRSILQKLGERPDHESIDSAKAKIAEIDSALTKKLEDILLAPGPADVDRMQWRLIQSKKEEECRKAADKEKQLFKAVVSLDEMHELYGKSLKEAEKKLETIYEAAAAGRDPEERLRENNPAPAKEQVSEEVVAILQDACNKNVEMIDLSARRLRHLPEAFGRISSLLVLNLSANQLEVIPDSIAGLEHLHELNLSSNHLESLPDSIGFLVNMKTLDVSSNKLPALPDSISYCRSLIELDASFNKLTYLPTHIGFQLTHLQRLSAQLNKIRSLPTSIGEMQSLRLLDLHFNELRGLPNSIGRLTNLEILNLSSNFSDLTELPETISDLENLKELDLSNNQIRELPLTFGRLSKLTKLNLDQNPLVVPPNKVAVQGAEAVKVFMTRRWLDVILYEEKKSEIEAQEQQMQSSWLARSASWLNSFVVSISTNGPGQAEAMAKRREDPYLNKPL